MAHASEPRATFSSLQQLLALKNRVLMELQQHGFGSQGSRAQHADGAHAASGAPSVSPASVVAAASGTQLGQAPVASARAQTVSDRFVGIGGYGFALPRASIIPAAAAVVAAIVAALLVVLGAMALSKRKRRAALTKTSAAPLSSAHAPSAS
ncbi:MAG TPA: hypothetical protein VGZ01_09875, partial [Trinickia sp.]|nr:hypothetical protein [Trinickia sp.]